MWGFPKITGTFLVVPIIRTIIYWGPYRGPGNYHIYIYIYIQPSLSATNCCARVPFGYPRAIRQDPFPLVGVLEDHGQANRLVDPERAVLGLRVSRIGFKIFWLRV